MVTNIYIRICYIENKGDEVTQYIYIYSIPKLLSIIMTDTLCDIRGTEISEV